MATHKLIPYWIEVREAEDPETSWDQTNIHRHEPEFPKNNLADYFHDFLKDYTDEVYVDGDRKKTFTVAEPIKRNGNTIEGRFKAGKWGRSADFWDVYDGERIPDAREENHAEEIPYYFLFHIPDTDNRQALLIISKYKRKGVKTLFEQLFRPSRQNKDVGTAYMTINPHYSDKVIEKIENADKLAAVRFRGKDIIPAREEYADRKHIEKVNDEISGQLDVGTEMKITPKGNQSAFRELVKSFARGENEQKFDYGKIEEENFSSASVTVVEGESQLTFSLWKEQIQMRMDVDADEYNLDIHGGHPTPYSLGRVARQLANDLMRDRNTELDTESLIPRTVGVTEEEETDEIPAAQD